MSEVCESARLSVSVQGRMSAPLWGHWGERWTRLFDLYRRSNISILRNSNCFFVDLGLYRFPILRLPLLRITVLSFCSNPDSLFASLLLSPLLETFFPHLSLLPLPDLGPTPNCDDRKISVVLLHRIEEDGCRSGSGGWLGRGGRGGGRVGRCEENRGSRLGVYDKAVRDRSRCVQWSRAHGELSALISVADAKETRLDREMRSLLQH